MKTYHSKVLLDNKKKIPHIKKKTTEANNLAFKVLRSLNLEQLGSDFVLKKWIKNYNLINN